MTDFLLTLRNSKTRDPVEYRDSAFERKSSPRDKRPREAGVSRGVRGHSPPGNFEISYFWNAIFSILMGKSKWFNCCKFKVMPAVKVVSSLNFFKYTISLRRCLLIVLIVSLSYFASSVESLVDVYKVPCRQFSGLCRLSLLPLGRPHLK